MILIISDPTPAELDTLKKLLGDLSVEVQKDRPLEIVVEKKRDWLSAQEFTKEVAKMGYSCKGSVTRKRLCDRWGINYEKMGNHLYFRNELNKIPVRKTKRNWEY